jgi:Na+/melibiose symporter-like transporter
VVSIIPVLSWVAALAGAAIAIASGPRPVAGAFVLDRLLRYAFIFPVGLMGFWAALGHIVFPARVAPAIGWQTSPFQFEVGVANLGLAFAGLYAAFRSFEARLATTLALACFLIGAGIGHIGDIITAGNFAPGNAGPILFTDLLTPAAILLLLWFSRPRGEEREAVPRRTPARREG